MLIRFLLGRLNRRLESFKDVLDNGKNRPSLIRCSLDFLVVLIGLKRELISREYYSLKLGVRQSTVFIEKLPN